MHSSPLFARTGIVSVERFSSSHRGLLSLSSIVSAREIYEIIIHQFVHYFNNILLISHSISAGDDIWIGSGVFLFRGLRHIVQSSSETSIEKDSKLFF